MATNMFKIMSEVMKEYHQNKTEFQELARRKNISKGLRRFYKNNLSARKHSEITKKKMSLSAKKRYENLDAKLITSEATKKAWCDPVKKRRHDKGCKNNGKNGDINSALNMFKGKIYRDTKIELKVRELLDLLYIKYISHYFLVAKSINWHEIDIAILDHKGKLKMAIECDGCYYHGCPKHYPERKNPRDKLIDDYLESIGVKVFRFFECEINRTQKTKKVLEGLKARR